jgi:predicted TIM-barrel fold metal-dependent hydrolase
MLTLLHDALSLLGSTTLRSKERAAQRLDEHKAVVTAVQGRDPDAAELALRNHIWARFVEADVPITFHVSTGKDPRTTRGLGGAVINYVVNSLSPTMEPLVNICASGVAERFPDLRFGSVEAGIGWLPWMLDAMDEAYQKHHFWVRPKLKALPSDYFRSKGVRYLRRGPGGRFPDGGARA